MPPVLALLRHAHNALSNTENKPLSIIPSTLSKTHRGVSKLVVRISSEISNDKSWPVPREIRPGGFKGHR